MLRNTQNCPLQPASANRPCGQTSHDPKQPVTHCTNSHEREISFPSSWGDGKDISMVKNIPKSDKHNNFTQLHQRNMAAHSGWYDGDTGLHTDNNGQSMYGGSGSEHLNYDSFPSQSTGSYDGTPYRLNGDRYPGNNYFVVPGNRGWNYYREHVRANHHPDNYMNHGPHIGLDKPTNLLDKIKDRLCDYIENPVLFVRLGCSVVLHTIMGSVLASTVLGAGMTTGIFAPMFGMVALPALTAGAVGGGVLGFYNDFVLNKPLLPNGFSWLDGLTQTDRLPKYVFTAA